MTDASAYFWIWKQVRAMSRFEDLPYRPCVGCAQRAAALNRWVVFTR